MAKYTSEAWVGKHLFVGIDVHRKEWHVTILTEDQVRLFSNRIPGAWVSLRRVLSKYKKEASEISAVYEAGFSGYTLRDRLVRYGVNVTVTPPNKIPQAVGDRVKTNRIDSIRLADLLRARLLRGIYVPTPEERSHREVARKRRLVIQDRCRSQQRIKSFLRFHSLELPEENKGKWSLAFIDKLRSLKLRDRWAQESFQLLLDEFDALDRLEKRQTSLLRELARSDKYRDQVAILETIPQIGWKTAIEILIELQDVRRFRNGKSLGAYVGLTPAQDSTGEKTRMGRITKQGHGSVRALLIEASWRIIREDVDLRRKYEAIKRRSGSKKAIVAVARRLVIRMRRILIDQDSYATTVA